MDRPVARLPELGEHLAIHDGVGAAFVWDAPLDRDILREVVGPGVERHRDDRFGQVGLELVKFSRSRADGGRSHLRDQRGKGIIVGSVRRPMQLVRPTRVMDRCCWQARFDQFDSSTVDDLVVVRRGDGDGPAKVMRDAETHVAIMPAALGDRLR